MTLPIPPSINLEDPKILKKFGEEMKRKTKENWEEDYDLFGNYLIGSTDPTKHFSEDPLFQEIRLSIRQYLAEERQKAKEEIIEKIDKDYKGRDITIYELSDWLKKVAKNKK